ELFGQLQRLLDRGQVMAVDGTEVLDPELVEHSGLSGADHVLESALDAVDGAVGRASGRTGLTQGLLAPGQELLVAGRGAQLVEVGSESADGRGVGAAVVVDDDDQPPRRGRGVRGDGVQRLPGHAAGQCSVADDGHDVTVVLTGQLPGFGDAVGPGQGGRGVGVLEHIVLALGPARIAGETVALAEGGEPLGTAGDEFVHVRLVADVEDDGVARGVEDPVEAHGQFDDAEVGSEVPAGAGHARDQVVPDLLGQDLAFLSVEPAQLGRRIEGFEKCHSASLLTASATDGFHSDHPNASLPMARGRQAGEFGSSWASSALAVASSSVELIPVLLMNSIPCWAVSRDRAKAVVSVSADRSPSSLARETHSAMSSVVVS